MREKATERGRKKRTSSATTTMVPFISLLSTKSTVFYHLVLISFSFSYYKYGLVKAQLLLLQQPTTTTNVSDLMESLMPQINITTCTNLLLTADRDHDEQLNQFEFLLLLQSISCFEPYTLNSNQFQLYQSLACLCKTRNNDSNEECCSNNETMSVQVKGIQYNSSSWNELTVTDIFALSLVCESVLKVVDGGYVRPELFDDRVVVEKNITDCPSAPPSIEPSLQPTIVVVPATAAPILPAPILLPAPPTTPAPITSAAPVNDVTLARPTPVPTSTRAPIGLIINPTPPSWKDVTTTGDNNDPPFPPIPGLTLETFAPSIDLIVNPKEAFPPTMKPILLSLETSQPTKDEILTPKEDLVPTVKPISLQIDTVAPSEDYIITPKAPSIPLEPTAPVVVSPQPPPPPVSAPAPVGPYSPCINAIIESDADNNEGLSYNEFTNFVTIMYCPNSNELTLIQSAVFEVLRCLCELDPPYLKACCFNTNEINVSGVKNAVRSSSENFRLARVCVFNQNLTGCAIPSVPAPIISASPIAVPTIVQQPQVLLLPTQAPVPLVDEDRTEACIETMASVDENKDQYMNEREYILFLQQLDPPPKSCDDTITTLNTIQSSAFYGQACLCLDFPNCCSKENAKVSIDGANLSIPDRTFQQSAALQLLCTTLVLPCSENNNNNGPPASVPSAPSDIISTPAPVVTNPIQVPAPISKGTTPSGSVDGNAPIASPTTTSSNGVDTSVCETLLILADENNDNLIDSTEYVSLIKFWVGCDISSTMELSNEEKTVFITLACDCLLYNPANTDCCSGTNGRILIDGVRVQPTSSRTKTQYDTIQRTCTEIGPAVQERNGVCDNNNSNPTTTGIVTSPIQAPTISQPNRPTDTGGGDNTVVTCAETLVLSDFDSDEYINLNEFRNLLLRYSGCDKNDNDSNDDSGNRLLTDLDSTIQLAFYELACLCLQIDNASNNCCIPRNARIDATGAELLPSQRTKEQVDKLNTICDTVNSILPPQCPTITPTTSTSSPIQSPSLSSTMSPVAVDPTNIIAPTSSSNNVTTTTPVSAPVVVVLPTTSTASDCTSKLVLSDTNSDGYLNREEYRQFLLLYNGCDEKTTTLSIQQETDFQLLAFPCVATEGVDCVLPTNAKFSIDGATLLEPFRTMEQVAFLTQICSISKSTDCNTPNDDDSATEIPIFVEGLEHCVSELHRADTNNDELLDMNEYLLFVRAVSNCPLINELQLSHEALFYSLSCECIKTTRNYDCCSPTNARLSIGSNNTTEETRNSTETGMVSRICSSTKELVLKQDCSLLTPASSPTIVSEQDLSCTQMLVLADTNYDNHIDVNEYLSFIRYEYKDQCSTLQALSFAQWVSFIILACFCMTEPNSTMECCNSGTPSITITGALLSPTERTSRQTKSLARICTVTNATINMSCQRTLPPTPLVEVTVDGNNKNNNDDNEDDFVLGNRNSNNNNTVRSGNSTNASDGDSSNANNNKSSSGLGISVITSRAFNSIIVAAAVGSVLTTMVF